MLASEARGAIAYRGECLPVGFGFMDTSRAVRWIREIRCIRQYRPTRDCPSKDPTRRSHRPW